jgi:hypothetical protein
MSANKHGSEPRHRIAGHGKEKEENGFVHVDNLNGDLRDGPTNWVSQALPLDNHGVRTMVRHAYLQNGILVNSRVNPRCGRNGNESHHMHALVRKLNPRPPQSGRRKENAASTGTPAATVLSQRARAKQCNEHGYLSQSLGIAR